MAVLAPALPTTVGRPRPVSVGPETRLLGVVAILTALLLVCAAVRPDGGHAVVPLRQDGIAVGADGTVRAIGATDRLVPGTRVLAGTPDSARLAAAERAWLAAGTVPAPTALGGSTMITDALLDLRLLSADRRAATAGWDGPWAYVWPRDSAFVTVALARTGHLAEAERTLDYLQDIQASDGSFEARYQPDRSTAPDGRSAQLDGTGWAVWALDQTASTLPADRAQAFLQRHRLLLDRSRGLLLSRTAGPGFPVSPDYWETAEDRPTLATSAVLLAGVTSAASAYRRLGADRIAAALAERAEDFGRRLTAASAPGFGRHLGDDRSTADLGVAFLLPPFAPAADPSVLAGWHRSLVQLDRPAGGLAPGGGWKSDGISWTPTTATEAMTAAATGDREDAVRLLRWIDAHRTPTGAIPEKVLWDGRPASVAPLAWSAAAVVIAAGELDR